MAAENDTLTRALEKLVEIGRRQERPTVIDIKDGSRRFLVRDDETRSYDVHESVLRPEIVLGQLDSFVDFVSADLKGPHVADKDDVMPVIVFGREGASYYRDVNDPRNVVPYKRRFSAGYVATCKATDQTNLDHHAFQRVLRALRPWLDKAPEVIRAFGKVLFERTLNITSSPTLVEGKGGLSYVIDYAVKGVNGQTSLPSEIVLSFPFSEGSTLPPMQVTLDVDIVIGDEGEREKALRFDLSWPDKAAAVERAVDAEVQLFADSFPEKDVLVLIGG